MLVLAVVVMVMVVVVVVMVVVVMVVVTFVWCGASCSHVLSISPSTLSWEAHIHTTATLTTHTCTQRESVSE